ncbi:alpha/beta fold hydrolase [Nocardia asteroides]|uniref:alpha/beta fold hydrolase n=1 Tax=Nocardia asteroides TaxID=1824 RepID=UPI003434AF42
MPVASVNGVTLSYQVKGSGPLVMMIMGTGSPGRVWHLHQVSALIEAGYRVCTFDNRGIAPSSECALGMEIEDLVSDTAGLISMLGSEPAAVVGTSMGSVIGVELALAHPDLVRKVIAMAGHARPCEFQKTLSRGERQLDEAGISLPAPYAAALTAVMNLSPATMADPQSARDWLDLFEAGGGGPVSGGVRAQRRMARDFDRRTAYQQIMTPTMAIGFADDRLIPASLTKELAECIPGAIYVEIADAGHLGYLEQPEAVNKEMLSFLAE